MEVDFKINGSIPQDDAKLLRSVSTGPLGREISDLTIYKEVIDNGSYGKDVQWFFQATAGNDFTGREKLPLIPASAFEIACLKKGVWDAEKAVEYFYPMLNKEQISGKEKDMDDIVINDENQSLRVYDLNPYGRDNDPRSPTFDERVLIGKIENMSTGEYSQVKVPISDYDFLAITNVMSVREAAEKYLGSDLKLPCHYEQFHLPEGIEADKTYILSQGSGKRPKVYAHLNGDVADAEISYKDYQALSSGLATKNQIVAKYLGSDIKAMADYSNHMKSNNVLQESKSVSLKL